MLYLSFIAALLLNVLLQLIVVEIPAPEALYPIGVLTAFALGRVLGEFSGRKALLFAGVNALVFFAILLRIVPYWGDYFLTGAVLSASFAPLLLGWLSRHSSRLHWAWLAPIGFMMIFSSNAPLHEGYHRMKFFEGVLILLLAAWSLRHHLTTVPRHVLFLLPFLAIEVWTGLSPNTTLLFPTWPLAAIFAVLTYLIASVLPSRWGRRLGGSAVLAGALVFTLVGFRPLMFQDDFEQGSDPYRVPFGAMEKVGPLGITPAAYENKTVYVDLWSINCGVCFHMYPEIEALYEEFGDQPHTAVVTVTSGRFDDREDIEAFLEKHQFKFPVLYDRKSVLATYLKTSGVPISFLVEPDGTIIDLHRGFNTHLADYYWTRVRGHLRRYQNGPNGS
ncbi:MAG: TlpA disulfide reductase family protein [Bacteroidota bacterium]